MNAKASAKRLESLIFAAAFLHREFLGQRATERFLTEPEARVSYVFDNDIIAAYAAPWELGPDRFGNEGTGPVLGHLLPRRSNALTGRPPEELEALRGDEDIRAQHITHLLTRYCLTPGSKRQLIWQFNEHYGETERNIARARHLAGEVGRAGRLDEPDQQLRNAVLILRARLGRLNDDYSRQDVADSVRTVAAIHLRRENLGPNRLLRQLERLDSFESTFSTRHILAHPADLPDVVLPPLSPTGEAEHGRALQLLRDFWQREISAGRLRHDDASDLRDADCLATLTVLNKRLLEAGVRHRVVFVTGTFSLSRQSYACERQLQRFLRDRAIQETIRGRDREEANAEHLAWRRYFGFPVTGEEVARHSNWFARFSLHYVRHLWAFAKDALIESDATSKLENLFHGLFALRSEKAAISRSEVEDLIARPWLLKLTLPESDPDQLYLSALAEWDRLIQSSVEQRIETEFGLTHEAIDTLQKKFPGTSGVDAADVAALIRELVDRQRDRSMLELSDMGAMSLIIEKELAVRFPPDLYFSSLNHTDTIFQSLFSNIYENNGAQFVRDYQDIYRDCVPIEETESGDDRLLSYLKFLALGAVFASTEKWATALGHATRAINTIKRYPREPVAIRKADDPSMESNISGREAYYLAAFCSRMVSSMGQNQHVMGSASAADYLKRARNAYAEDVYVKPSLATKLNGLRFDCEELAQELSTYYMARWRDTQEGTAADLRKYRMEPLYRAASRLLKGLGSSDDPLQPFGPATTFQTQISIATNILQVATIQAFRAARGFPDYASEFHPPAALLERCVLFLNALTDQQPPTSKSLVRVYMNAGAIIIGRPDLTGLDSVDDVVRLFEGASPARVLIYDPWRFEMLKSFLLEKLANLPPPAAT
jgi:hypothetical protein